MKRILFIAIACTAIGTNLYSQSEDIKHAGFQFTFIYPLSTNGINAYLYTNGASLNALAGLSRNETAFALGGLTNIILHDATGVQIAGLYNHVGNDRKGFLLSGLASYVGNSSSGVQFSGLANIAGSIDGLQFASLVNIAGKVRGVQFGVVNIADENDYPIGLVNLIKKGRKSIAVTCNETGSMTVSFRSGGKVTYGIVGYGYNFKAGKKTYLAEGGLGIRLPVASKFGINNEFKIETFHSSDNATGKAGYSLLPAYQFTPHIEIFAGPSINYMYSDDINHADMFPSHSLWKKRDASTRQQVFIGYQLGVQYVF